MLDIGRLPRSPLTSLVTDSQQVSSGMNDAPASISKSSCDKFIKKLSSDLIEARDNILLAQEHQISSANSHRRPEVFNIGDEVLVQADALRSSSVQATRPKSKLDLKYEGPFKIIKVINDNAYRLEIPIQFGVHNVFNITKLKRLNLNNSFPHRAPLKPSPDNTRHTGPETVIHKILARKRVRGRPRHGQDPNDPRRYKYLTQWEGEPQYQATWELRLRRRDISTTTRLY